MPIRKAVSIGGDSDTIACMAGGIAQAFYKTIPVRIREEVLEFLAKRLKGVTQKFIERYGVVV